MRHLAIARRHPRLRIDRASVARAIAALDGAAGRFRGGCPAGELSLVFLTEEALAGIHGAFLDDPTPTDVITFPGDPAVGQAGEICVSADAALARAGRKGFSDELSLYVVHGWLHLAGYDDTTAAARRAMRSAEARAINALLRADARPRFRLVI